MKAIILPIFTFLLLAVGCNNNNKKTVTLYNNSEVERVDEVIKIDEAKLSEFDISKLSAFVDGIEIPSQVIYGSNKSISFLVLVDFKPNEKKEIVLKESNNKKVFPKRTHAEISEKRDYIIVDDVYTEGHFVSVKESITPPNHIDHNYYYKMEGPAWESDKVGYRIYLDWRNSTDIFGKKIPDVVLPKVGHTKDADGHDTYHTIDEWGMDIFKVGNSLGIGTFAAFVDGKVVKVSKTDSTICTIRNDGVISSSLDINYFGWKFGNEDIDLKSSIKINAGSRLTHYKFEVDSNSEFCTGLAKHKNTEFIKSEINSDNSWNFIALWGNQSLAGPKDKVGIALFYNNSQLVKLTEDDLSYITVLKPITQKLDYYFAACWEQEKDGIKNIAEFKNYLDKTVVKLNNPVELK